MEIYLTVGSIVLGVLVAYFVIKSNLKINKELDIGIKLETSDLRIQSKSEMKGLVSTFSSSADYLKIVLNNNENWLLKTRGFIKGSSYNLYKISNKEKDEISTFKITQLKIGGEQGKIVIQNIFLNKVSLTFRINDENDFKILEELRNYIK